MSMSCFDCHDYMDGYNRGKKEGVIEELKQIEKRFEEEIEKSVNTNRYRDGIAFCKAVIHNTITKLNRQTTEKIILTEKQFNDLRDKEENR